MAVTAVTYVRARSATLVIYAGRRPVVVRMRKRDLARLLRRGGVAVIRRHSRGLTLRLGPDAAVFILRHMRRNAVLTVRDAVRLLGAWREYSRFLRMWGIDARDAWDRAWVVLTPRRPPAGAAGEYHPVGDVIVLYAGRLLAPRQAAMILVHELSHRAAKRCDGDGAVPAIGDTVRRLRERIPPPRPDLEWWASKEELTCELAASIAASRGRVERGAMKGLAGQIAEMPAEDAAKLWRHTRWGPEGAPRAAGDLRPRSRPGRARDFQ